MDMDNLTSSTIGTENRKPAIQKADCISGGCSQCLRKNDGYCRGGWRDPRIDKTDSIKAERIKAIEAIASDLKRQKRAELTGKMFLQESQEEQAGEKERKELVQKQIEANLKAIKRLKEEKLEEKIKHRRVVQKAYRERNAEKLRIKKKAYREKHKEELKEKRRVYQSKTRAMHNKTERERYARSEEMREKKKRYYIENRERLNELRRIRRAKKREEKLKES